MNTALVSDDLDDGEHDDEQQQRFHYKYDIQCSNFCLFSMRANKCRVAFSRLATSLNFLRRRADFGPWDLDWSCEFVVRSCNKLATCQLETAHSRLLLHTNTSTSASEQAGSESTITPPEWYQPARHICCIGSLANLAPLVCRSESASTKLMLLIVINVVVLVDFS